MLNTKNVNNACLRRKFLTLPYGIYKSVPRWTPMIYRDVRKLLQHRGSQLFQNGEQDFFLAFDGKEAVGRICVGIDHKMNIHKGVKHAYFTLFESYNRREIAELLLHRAVEYAKSKGANYIKGPVSPTNGDDYRGLLVQGFDEPSYILNNYNPPYYTDFFSSYDVYLEYYGYTADLTIPIKAKVIETIRQIMSRYAGEKEDFNDLDAETLVRRMYEWYCDGHGYRIVDAHDVNLDIISHGVYQLLQETMPDWEEDIVPPTLEDTRKLAKDFLRFTERGLSAGVFLGDEMISFALVVPNYSPVIRKINGKLFPLGWFRLLMARGKMDTARAILLFVSSKHANEAVSGGLIIKIRENLIRLGYRKVEFSTISSHNRQMTAVARFLGLTLYKRYVIYGKALTQVVTARDIYGKNAYKYDKSNE